MKNIMILLVFSCLVSLADAEDGNALQAYWDSGLRVRSEDESFKLKIGGRIQVDWATYSQNSSLKETAGEMESGVEVRRAEFYSEGKIYNNVIYKLEIEFAGELGLEDAYIQVNNLPVGDIRFGHDEEPFCMDELTSNKYYTFMERSLLDLALAPGTDMGCSIRNEFFDERVRFAAGAFMVTGGKGESPDGNEVAFGGRVTGLPICSEDGRGLVHLGAAVNTRKADEELLVYKTRPESHLAENMVDTGELAAESATLYGGELAAVYGSSHLQAEYVSADVDLCENSSASFSSYYVQAGYFLTGEHKPYSKSEGVFGRVMPKKNFNPDEGDYGAWEVAARYSYIDLEDSAVNGGTMTSITAGINWYLNPNTRMMLNYISAEADDKYDGSVDIVQARMQVDF